MRSIGTPELLIILCLSSLFLVPFWRIAQKAGYPGWYGLTVCVPILNVIMLWWFAFSDWPSLRRR